MTMKIYVVQRMHTTCCAWGVSLRSFLHISVNYTWCTGRMGVVLIDWMNTICEIYIFLVKGHLFGILPLYIASMYDLNIKELNHMIGIHLV